MGDPRRHVALFCGALVIHSIFSVKDGWGEQELWRVNLHERALQLYLDLIHKAQHYQPECVLHHVQRYEVLNQSIAYHWRSCLRAVPSFNNHLLQVCMEDRAHGDLAYLINDMNELRDCMSEKENAIEKCTEPLPSDVEWAKQVAEVKNNLPAMKKNNEFYVTVENAKLANKTNCYNEFSPLVGEFAASIELVVSNCLKFVPVGHLQEFKKCCDDLLQPTQSDIESKLMYVTTCGT